MIHIYCGDGKGKTTAALGLAVRAAGWQIPVLAVRFLKNDESGEVEALRRLPGVTVRACDRTFGFSWTLTDEQREEAKAYYQQLFEESWRAACAGGGLVILDELIGACSLGFVREETVLKALQNCPEGLEVVLTGRGPSEELTRMADYVTEMKCIKHPLSRGIRARKGIEY